MSSWSARILVGAALAAGAATAGPVPAHALPGDPAAKSCDAKGPYAFPNQTFLNSIVGGFAALPSCATSEVDCSGETPSPCNISANVLAATLVGAATADVKIQVNVTRNHDPNTATWEEMQGSYTPPPIGSPVAPFGGTASPPQSCGPAANNELASLKVNSTCGSATPATIDQAGRSTGDLLGNTYQAIGWRAVCTWREPHQVFDVNPALHCSIAAQST